MDQDFINKFYYLMGMVDLLHDRDEIEVEDMATVREKMKEMEELINAER